MDAEERQFLLTSAWLFARHGQSARTRIMVEALVEENPRDGVSAAVLAELQLSEGDARAALDTLRSADFPADLARAEAVLETRALMALGRKRESESRWRRFLNLRNGGARDWIGAKRK